MAQVLEFKLPDLGEGLTEAEIVRWLVQVGDVVAIDQPVVEVETAKAMVEVPCPYGGVVTARFGEEGEELPVGAPLLTVAVGEPASSGGAASGTGSPSGGEGSTGGAGSSSGGDGSAEGSGNVLVGYGTGAPPARRRRVRPTALTSGAPAAGPAHDSAGATTAPARRRSAVPAASVAAAPTSGGAHGEGPVPVISPLVRRLARENGLDLRALRGSGPDGLILRADVEQALRAAQTGTAVASPAAPAAQPAARPAPQPAAAAARPSSAPRRRGPRPAQGRAGCRRRQAVPQPQRDPGRHLLGGCRRDGTDAGEGRDERRRGAEDLPAGAAGPDLHGRAGPFPRAELLRRHRCP
ncbi:hypothetical protein GCM10020256_36550 [Streptomyces thermocoprophilus]